MVHSDETYDNLPRDELAKRHCDWNPGAFDAFWKAYPIKANKVHAMRAWDRLRLPEQELPVMASYLEAYKLHGGYTHSVADRNEIPFYKESGHYFTTWGFKILPADVFLLDQPWVL